VTWAHNAEMTPVQGGDFGQFQALGDSNHWGVCCAERKAAILCDEICHARIISSDKINDGENTFCHRPQEQ